MQNSDAHHVLVHVGVHVRVSASDILKLYERGRSKLHVPRKELRHGPQRVAVESMLPRSMESEALQFSQ